jgi:hypothetical protein
MKRREINLGDKFNRLTFVRELPPVVRNRSRRRVVCECDCGAMHEVELHNLVRGYVQSCGCLHREVRPTIRLLHGMTGTPTFRAWVSMRERCRNPKNKCYHMYGGRGIVVCDRWDSFKEFLEDMGIKPSGASSVERIDNSKGYSPDNCKWAYPTEQANNRRSNRLITYEGNTLSLSAWAREKGLKPQTLGKRLKDGWPVEKALNTPVRRFNYSGISDDPGRACSEPR